MIIELGSITVMSNDVGMILRSAQAVPTQWIHCSFQTNAVSIYSETPKRRGTRAHTKLTVLIPSISDPWIRGFGLSTMQKNHTVNFLQSSGAMLHTSIIMYNWEWRTLIGWSSAQITKSWDHNHIVDRSSLNEGLIMHALEHKDWTYLPALIHPTAFAVSDFQTMVTFWGGRRIPIRSGTLSEHTGCSSERTHQQSTSTSWTRITASVNECGQLPLNRAVTVGLHSLHPDDPWIHTPFLAIIMVSALLSITILDCFGAILLCSKTTMTLWKLHSQK